MVAENTNYTMVEVIAQCLFVCGSDRTIYSMVEVIAQLYAGSDRTIIPQND